MDDKTFIAAYVAKEAERINERLKTAVTAESPPSEDERQALVADIETTLSRLQRALMQVQMEMESDTEKVS